MAFRNGTITIGAADRIDAMFQPDGRFDAGRLAGFQLAEIREGYADAMIGAFEASGFGNVQAEWDSAGLRVTAVNAHGSSIDFNFVLNKQLGLEVDYLAGTSVDTGRAGPIEWTFDGPVDGNGLEPLLSGLADW